MKENLRSERQDIEQEKNMRSNSVNSRNLETNNEVVDTLRNW